MTSSPPPQRADYWGALRLPLYRSLWLSAFVSNLGTWLERVAVGVYVAESTGRSGWSGLAAAALFLPSLVMAPVGGALSDRFDRRSYLLTIVWVQIVVSALLTWLAFLGQLSMPVLLVLLVGIGCSATMMWPAFNAMLTEQVPESVVRSAIVLHSGQFNLARMVGPAIGAAVIAVGGVPWAFALNTLSFLAILPVVMGLERRRPDSSGSEPLWVQIRQGLEAVRAEPGIRTSLTLSISSSFLVAPFMGLVPIFVIRDLHSDAAGVSLLMTVQGLGAVIAAAASTACMEIFGTRRWIAGAAIALMIFDALFWLMPTVPTAALMMTLLGSAYLAMMSGGKSVSLSRAPRAVRGRVASLYTAGVDGSYGLGVSLIGGLGDLIGVRAASLLGTAAFATILLTWGRRGGVLLPELTEAPEPTRRTPTAEVEP